LFWKSAGGSELYPDILFIQTPHQDSTEVGVERQPSQLAEAARRQSYPEGLVALEDAPRHDHTEHSALRPHCPEPCGSERRRDIGPALIVYIAEIRTEFLQHARQTRRTHALPAKGHPDPSG
jgi:hypothetical protein